MSIAIAVTDHWDDGKRRHVTGTLVFSGNYVNNGDTLNFSGAVMEFLRTTQHPVHVEINGIAGYDYKFNRGATPATGLVVVRQCAAAGAPLAQIAAAGYPAGVTGDTVRFYAILRKF